MAETTCFTTKLWETTPTCLDGLHPRGRVDPHVDSRPTPSPALPVALLDLRDHGLSKDILPIPAYDFDIVAEDILKVLDHLGIEKAHFVSLSIGGVILQKIDMLRPELVDRMVMAAPFRRELGDAFVRAQRARVEPHLALPGDLLDVLVHRVASEEPPHESWIFDGKSAFDAVGVLEMGGAVQAVFKLVKDVMSRHVAKPSLVVMGDQDHIFFKAAKQFAEVHRNVRLSVIENCGTCAALRPGALQRVGAQFLEGAEFPQRVTATPVPMSWSELKALQQPKA